MRLLTWNIRGGLGMDNRRSLKRIADVIRESQADIICLQEVHFRLPQSSFQNQPRTLGGLLEMPVHFQPSYRIGFGGFGNAIITKLPVQHVQLHALPNDEERRRPAFRFERRGLLVVEVNDSDIPGTLLTTHLSLNEIDRHRSVEAIARVVKVSRLPVILAGDFNAGPGGKEIEALKSFSGLADAGESNAHPTYPADNPSARIDFIFHSPELRLKKASVTQTLASDHLPLLIEW